MKLRLVPPGGLDILPPRMPPRLAAVLAQLPPEGFVRRPQVLAVIGCSKSTLRRRMRAGDFPKSVPLGPRIVGWDVAAVRGWIESKANKETNHG